MTVIDGRKRNKPEGLYWMRSRALGTDIQVRSESIIVAERLNGEHGVSVIYLGQYDDKHRIEVVESLDHLYDRPVTLNASEQRG